MRISDWSSDVCSSDLLDIVENFTLSSEHKAGLVKIIGQNHQVLGVNNAIASMLEARRLGHGRGGVFWQTQGSGKSFRSEERSGRERVFSTCRSRWSPNH